MEFNDLVRDVLLLILDNLPSGMIHMLRCVSKILCQACDEIYPDQQTNYLDFLKYVCSNYHLKLLQNGFNREFKHNGYTSLMACYYGAIEILQWLESEGFFCDNYESNDKLSYPYTLLYSPGNDKNYVSHACIYAAIGGRIKVLKWLLKNDYKWNYQICQSAALSGHKNILEWAKTKGCKWDTCSIASAAYRGHFEIVKWLYLNSDCLLFLNSNIVHAAVQGGHLDILIWAYEQGAYIDKLTCYYAATGGHTTVLKWLLNNNCHYNTEDIIKYIDSDDIELADIVKRLIK